MNKTDTQLRVGEILTGEVYKITKFGAFVKLPLNKKGLLHISQISDDYVKNISEHIKIGDNIKVRVVASEGSRVDLSLKLNDFISSYPKNKEFKSSDLEDRLNSILKHAR